MRDWSVTIGNPPSARIFIIIEVPERGSPETTMIGCCGTDFFPNPEKSLLTTNNLVLSGVLQDPSGPHQQLETAVSCLTDRDAFQLPGREYRERRSCQNRLNRDWQKSLPEQPRSPYSDQRPNDPYSVPLKLAEFCRVPFQRSHGIQRRTQPPGPGRSAHRDRNRFHA